MMGNIQSLLSSGAGFAKLSDDINKMNRAIEALYQEMYNLRLELKRWNDRAERQ
jgi:sensor histidine kinase YesM